jgi:hypothetical protein
MACKCENDKANEAARLTLNAVITFWVECQGDVNAMTEFFLKMQETLAPSEDQC